jgi:lantibiotic modifying enzyme
LAQVLHSLCSLALPGTAVYTVEWPQLMWFLMCFLLSFGETTVTAIFTLLQIMSLTNVKIVHRQTKEYLLMNRTTFTLFDQIAQAVFNAG